MKTFLPFLLILLISGCQKDEFNPSQIDFKNKPLAVIKASIEGNWRVYSTKGGMLGTIEYPKNTFMQFNDNSVRIASNSDTVSFEVTWKKKKIITGRNAYIMENSNWGFFKIPVGINNDTLKMSDNYPEGYGYKLVRAN